MSQAPAEMTPPIIEIGVGDRRLDFFVDLAEAEPAVAESPQDRFFDAAGHLLTVVSRGDAAAGVEVGRDQPPEGQFEAEVRAALEHGREAARREPDILDGAGYASFEELSTDIDYLLASTSREELVARLRAALHPDGAAEASAFRPPPPFPPFCCFWRARCCR